MQTMVFTGRLAADPQVSPDFAKAVFRLLEKRGVDAGGKDRIVGVNCVSWARGLNEKVIARGLAKGCEALVGGGLHRHRLYVQGRDRARRQGAGGEPADRPRLGR